MANTLKTLNVNSVDFSFKDTEARNEIETINEEKLIEELVNDLSSEIDGAGDNLEELGEELDQEFLNIINE